MWLNIYRLGCRTEDLSKMCVFPFVYKNEVYSSCTMVDTSNEKAWCATYPARPGGIVALHTAPHWDDCEEQCQNTCYSGDQCSKGSFCHYDMYCQLALCSNSAEDCKKGRICKAQEWCEEVHGFERCPRECSMISFLILYMLRPKLIFLPFILHYFTYHGLFTRFLFSL